MVEDELLIAMDIVRALEGAGANATMTTTVRHALIWLSTTACRRPFWTMRSATVTAPNFARD